MFEFLLFSLIHVHETKRYDDKGKTRIEFSEEDLDSDEEMDEEDIESVLDDLYDEIEFAQQELNETKAQLALFEEKMSELEKKIKEKE